MSDHSGTISRLLMPALAAGLLGLAAPVLAQDGLAGRIVATDPGAFRQLQAVHAGAGGMAFAGLLNRGAVTPEFNFLHRGEIPPGSGIGHHFHNVAEEMFVILNGEAQFTIDGRTAVVRGPAAVVCPAGHSHAILNTGTETLQWMNFNITRIAGVGDAFDLGDTREGAVVDPVPTFMTMQFDRDQLRAAGGGFGRGAAASPPSATAVRSRRGLGPTVFNSTWSYVDHVLVPPGGATEPLAHADVGEAYYVLAGSGSIELSAPAADSAPVKTWDAIPVRLGETSRFVNTGTEPLELLVVGVARDMDAKIELMTGGFGR